MGNETARLPDGTEVRITNAVIQHIVRKYPDVLRILGVSEDGLAELLSATVLTPDEVYVDIKGSLFFLLRVNDLRLCVVVREGLPGRHT